MSTISAPTNVYSFDGELILVLQKILGTIDNENRITEKEKKPYAEFQANKLKIVDIYHMINNAHVKRFQSKNANNIEIFIEIGMVLISKTFGTNNIKEDKSVFTKFVKYYLSPEEAIKRNGWYIHVMRAKKYNGEISHHDVDGNEIIKIRFVNGIEMKRIEKINDFRTHKNMVSTKLIKYTTMNETHCTYNMNAYYCDPNWNPGLKTCDSITHIKIRKIPEHLFPLCRNDYCYSLFKSNVIFSSEVKYYHNIVDSETGVQRIYRECFNEKKFPTDVIHSVEYYLSGNVYKIIAINENGFDLFGKPAIQVFVYKFFDKSDSVNTDSLGETLKIIIAPGSSSKFEEKLKNLKMVKFYTNGKLDFYKKTFNENGTIKLHLKYPYPGAVPEQMFPITLLPPVVIPGNTSPHPDTVDIPQNVRGRFPELDDENEIDLSPPSNKIQKTN